MNPVPVLFAQSTLDFRQAFAPWFSLDPATREVLLIISVLALVTAGILVWAVFFRKRRRTRSHRHHRHQHDESRMEKTGAVPPTEESGQRRKQHRRRRDHRPRNPTLAETGGLPPIRTQPPPDSTL